MGTCMSGNRNKIGNDDEDKIMDINNLKVGKSDFIRQTEGKFGSYYKIGKALGLGKIRILFSQSKLGSFGEVRKCISKLTGTMRAVKILNKATLQIKDQKRFLYEIELLRELDHPNIVKVFEYFNDTDKIYIVTELCTGGELYEEMNKRRGKGFSEEEGGIIIQQLLSAVNYCHLNNIVHRDIKPENILIDSKKGDQIKLIDFGTAQKFTTGKSMTQTFGTAYYIAPEVLTSSYDQKCDVWSIGVIMYMLLSGKPPFDGVDDKQIIKKVKKGEIHVNTIEWKKKSRDAIDLLKKMLTKEAQKRVSCQEALDHPWIRKLGKAFVDKSEITAALNNLRNFKIVGKLQQAALTFIVTQLLGKSEIDPFRKVFNKLDRNGSGMVTREELLQMFKKYLGKDISDMELDRILAQVDADLSGEITFSEFLVACINPKEILTTDRLQAAFNTFDIDQSGFISMDEIKKALCAGKNIDDKVWAKVVEQVDINDDNEISFLEFKDMMEKIFNLNQGGKRDQLKLQQQQKEKEEQLRIQQEEERLKKEEEEKKAIEGGQREDKIDEENEEQNGKGLNKDDGDLQQADKKNKKKKRKKKKKGILKNGINKENAEKNEEQKQQEKIEEEEEEEFL
ncbi:protein kinase domain containing protein [Stylonychia lemnae]|uniref:non-specific serine/threonine protein kinase n=1 Tax=Stylonychia lemnae TaxID=5949 RepID=A0A077ZY98_STYLE|nr:protein kinase domain containing protein [Stylonychia lemnae]|eukprot:CDW74871.1 protein kinase domain containing protein [Stylonychia lemnae]